MLKRKFYEHLKVLQLSEFQKPVQQRVEVQLHLSIQVMNSLPKSMQTIVDVLLNANKNCGGRRAVG
ncbi:MAG: hypothetical protein R3E08_13070 [Thiotrichaceae bacterium]